MSPKKRNKKSKVTETTGMDWGEFLNLVQQLKKDKEYLFSLLISVGCYTGLRISDILNLRWEDVLGKQEVHIKEKKTSKIRLITINPGLAEIIEFVHKKLTETERISDDSDLIFINRSGSKLSIQYVNRKLHRLFEYYEVSVPKPSSHTLRKTFGKAVYEKSGKTDASLVLLSQIFKHSSTSVTRRYIGIQKEEIQNAYLFL